MATDDDDDDNDDDDDHDDDADDDGDGDGDDDDMMMMMGNDGYWRVVIICEEKYSNERADGQWWSIIFTSITRCSTLEYQ